ncbi:hypothetical protein LX36DRAFT_251812 [Colletotrichum falcatum]|nr:hypothetical protein LX36DRAFT_251812 [Colletotrichum falcatum]
MRYSLVFLLAAAAAVSAQRNNNPPAPPTPRTGGQCCDAFGVADPSETCKTKGLNSYCCNNRMSNVGTGCDGVPFFSIGRDVVAFPPGGPSCTGGGFIGCAT